MNTEQERAEFEAWLRVKPCGAAHDFAWEAWQARAALQSQDREGDGEWMRKLNDLLDEFQTEAASYGHPRGTDRSHMDAVRAEIIDHARRVEGES